MKFFASYRFKFILAVVALIFTVVLVLAFMAIRMIEDNAMEVFHERSHIAMNQASQYMDVEKIAQLAVTLDENDPYYIETCAALWDVRVTHPTTPPKVGQYLVAQLSTATCVMVIFAWFVQFDTGTPNT